MRKSLPVFLLVFSTALAFQPEQVLAQPSSKCCCFPGDVSQCFFDAALFPEDLIDLFCELGGGVGGPSSTYSSTTDDCNGEAVDDCATACALLPVEFVEFTVKQTSEGALLEWSTASELNNSHFEVQLAEQHGEFASLATIDGKGNSSVKNNYSFLALQMNTGLNRFRIMQVDFDGSFSYSSEIEYLEELPVEYSISTGFPNPFRSSASIQMSIAEKQNVQIQIFNLQGKIVQTLHSGILDAHLIHNFEFDASALPSGQYLYRAVGERFVSKAQSLTKID